jgi:hypothetical protein
LLQYRLRLAAIHGKKVLVTTTTHDRPKLFSGSQMPHFHESGAQQAEFFFKSI